MSHQQQANRRGEPLSTTCRFCRGDRSENRSAIDGTMRFEFTFDTPAPVEFDAYLRVVNNNMSFLPGTLS